MTELELCPREDCAAPVQAPAPAAGPTAEQVAALRAAGVDPASVFPGFTGA